MIKRTPQEIADFFGCYVAQDEAGCFMIYSEKPEFILEDEMYGVKNVWVMANKPEGVFEYITSLVDVPTDHDFHRLYEPNLSEKPTGSAPHQSEVHTHKEYCVIKNETPAGLSKQTTKLMDKGYKPLGGIAIGYEYGVSPRQYFYQAMVRGV